jgi:hypothetical protein
MAVQEHDHKTAHRLAVSISYNGMNQRVEYVPEEPARAIRAQALNIYNVHGPEREQNFLFGPDNQTEINLDASMGSQVQPGSQLYLRPRTAGGG